MANYSDAFSPSFKGKTFVRESFLNPNQLVSTEAINLENINFDAVGSLKFNPVAFTPGLDLLGGSSGGWTFITAPEDVSWDTANQTNRIDMFGTNNPPVVAGARGMRDLSLGNALVEGFVRNVSVEDKVAALEKLMNYELNASDGFVKVPVYQVKANDKAYGNGYFIIRDVKVKETMRDLKGNATRAYVDISLMQVPEYQVNSGRDLASKPAASAKALALPDPQATPAQGQAASNTAANATANQGVGTTQAAAGPRSAAKGNQPSTGNYTGPRGRASQSAAKGNQPSTGNYTGPGGRASQGAILPFPGR
jgi:hypothetical protein